MNPLCLARAAPALPWIVWHLCASTSLIALTVQLLEGKLLSEVPAERLPFFAGFAAAYLSAAITVVFLTREGRKVQLLAVASTVVAGLGAWAMLLLVLKVDTPRLALILFAVFTIASVFTSLACRQKILLGAAAVFGAIAIGCQLMGDLPRQSIVRFLDMGPKPFRSEAVLDTAEHLVSAIFFDRYFDVCDDKGMRCDTPRTGGALEALAGGFLYATGEGTLHFIDDHPGSTLVAKRLPVEVPINSADFVAGGANQRDLSVFRVMDILVKESAERFELYATHHHWDVAAKCFTMRVSRLTGKTADLVAGTDLGPWRTVWDAKPCLPLKMSKGGLKQFGGDGAGGRMLFDGSAALLVTIGDQQWDGWNWDHAVSQDLATDYGKLIRIDLTTGSSSVVASGLRNPEGLMRDRSGRLWSTEHGPQGGDELNIVVEGGNYGWPKMTYGREYGTGHWPLLEPGADDDPAFVRPVFSWVPSIGVSNLLQVKGKRFDRWRDDLLILSFNRSLHRAHIREGRVVVLEPIMVRARNGRLRDVVETDDGRLVLLLDLGAIAFLEPVDRTAKTPRALAARGGMLFSGCQQCHRHTDGTDHSIGPDLYGVIDRPIGSAKGFRYSSALSAKGGKWSREALDAFLRDPQAFAPGTAMQNAGLASPDDRSAVIAYLERKNSQ